MKKKILVVEDEESTAQLIEFILERNGMEFIHAPSGVKGLDRARKDHPDLILLDVMMPGMDGLEVCEALKKDIETRDIPIIFLTALGQEADVERGLKIGSNSYVMKPFDPSDLLHHINLILKP